MKLKFLILSSSLLLFCGIPAFAQSGGTIQGKLLKANGKPLAYTEIELVPVGANKIGSDMRLVATSSFSGLFAFRNLPKGRYTLSINFDDKPTDLSPYDTFFYPNTAERAEAEIFEIGEGTKITGIVFRLPAALVQKNFTGKVVYTDGVPVRGAFIAIRDINFDQLVSFGRAMSDANGNFTISGFVGRRYQLGAILFEKQGKTIFESDGPIIAAGESKIFTLSATTAIVPIVLREPKEVERIREKYIGKLLILPNQSFSRYAIK